MLRDWILGVGFQGTLAALARNYQSMICAEDHLQYTTILEEEHRCIERIHEEDQCIVKILVEGCRFQETPLEEHSEMILEDQCPQCPQCIVMKIVEECLRCIAKIRGVERPQYIARTLEAECHRYIVKTPEAQCH